MLRLLRGHHPLVGHDDAQGEPAPRRADLFRYAPIAGTGPSSRRAQGHRVLVLPALIVSGRSVFGCRPPRVAHRVPALLALPTLSLITGLAGDYIRCRCRHRRPPGASTSA